MSGDHVIAHLGRMFERLLSRKVTEETPFTTGQDKPRLTVAIPTYNGRHLLEVVLPSLAAQQYRDFRVLVVDDGSADGTVSWLREQWPTVGVVALSVNIGVTAALNVCVRESDTELMMLLNNDIELEPGCLGTLVQALDEHPAAGSASPKLIDYHDRKVIDGAGDILTWAGSPGRRGHGELDRGQYDLPQEIFGACGGAALYRRSAVDRVGLLDGDFFTYYEDTDWSLRAQLGGFTCRYVPDAVVYHMGSATLGREMTDFTRYHLWRNGVWLIVKDLPAASLIRHCHQLLYGQLWNFAMALRDRRLSLWARAMRDALGGLPSALRKRRAVQRTRCVSVRELELRISSAGS
jgi:GT2 family glycosyltransferase